ncbi:MAG: type III pantothenate kinase [Gallionella sp.]|nr:type III pantothenate kinase [Gallionella sp.]
MKLLIDAGNMRIKWAIASGDGWLCSGVTPTVQADSLAQGIAEQIARQIPGAGLRRIRQIWASNVAGESCALHIRGIGEEISAQPHFIAAREKQCGVRNCYAEPSQLGSDRWAALIASWHLVQRACLVVDSGTATTVDALSAQGEFVGGLILPGIELMQRSLTSAASQLMPSPGRYAPFPQNSADALYSGAIQASCGAIERQYNLLDDDRAPLLLSGGAAQLLLPHLDWKRKVAPPQVEDDLVLQGLLLMAREADCC